MTGSLVINEKYEVLTPSGFSDFSGISLMGMGTVWKVILEDGVWVECTDDHKFFSSLSSERKQIRDFRIGEEVFTKYGPKRLLSFENTGRVEPVYDLIEVDGGHRFYANGILSSNCEFIVFEETLVSSLKLSKIKIKDAIRRSGHVRWYKKINPEMSYAVTLDPSMGTGGDNAAITIWEMPTMEQVGEWYHNTTPIEGQMRVFKDILEEIWEQGNPDIYWSLETNSVGEAAMVIIRDTGQENFPGTFVHEPRSDGGPRKKRGFVTTQRTKRIACSRIKHWIESDKMKLNSGPLVNEFKNFIAKSNTYMAKQGCTDDLISSALVFVRLAEVVAKWNEDIYEAVKGDLNDTGGYDEEDPDFKQPLPVLM